MALHQPGVNDWYRIKNQADGPTQLHIYDEIGYFGVTAQDLIHDLADITGPIEVHFNSPGGEVFDGIAIYNSLLARGEVTGIIDGVAASITSVIAMACNPLLVARNAQVMIHEGHAMGIGSAQDFRDMAELLDKTSNNIASIYADHTGKPEAYWREKMKAETWYSGEEAIAEGLCDRFVPNGAGRRVADPEAHWDMSVFRNAASIPYVSETQSRHVPMTTGPRGHTHDHAAYEASDHDDGMHLHPHVHANDANHHHDHSAMPPESAHEPGEGHMGVGPSAHEHVHLRGASEEEMWALVDHFSNHDFTELFDWDAAAALAKCSSASDYRSICAGERSSGDPATQAHWALPHHSSPGAGPDKGGVSAALGRWNQTEGLKNKEAALSHLKAHARSLGLPSGDNLGDIEVWNDQDITQMINALKGV